MTRRALACGGLTLVLLLGGAATASSQSDQVTMVVTLFKSVNSGGLEVRASGVARGAPAGEAVDVLGRHCGAKPGDVRLIAQTQTGAGGGYRVEIQYWSSGTELRARWGDRVSDPYVVLRPADLGVMKVWKRRAWRVYVSPPQYSSVSMKGKVVELQRQSGGRWVRYRRAKLAERPSLDLGAFNHEARFDVPRRGLKLRAVLGKASAAPCYLKTITPSWRS